MNLLVAKLKKVYRFILISILTNFHHFGTIQAQCITARDLATNLVTAPACLVVLLPKENIIISAKVKWGEHEINLDV